MNEKYFGLEYLGLHLLIMTSSHSMTSVIDNENMEQST